MHVYTAAPFGRFGLKESVRALAEGWFARRESFRFALRLDRVDAFGNKLAGFVRFIAGLGERDAISRAEPISVTRPPAVNRNIHLRAPVWDTIK
jgi:hypothetical protein